MEGGSVLTSALEILQEDAASFIRQPNGNGGGGAIGSSSHSTRPAPTSVLGLAAAGVGGERRVSAEESGRSSRTSEAELDFTFRSDRGANGARQIDGLGRLLDAERTPPAGAPPPATDRSNGSSGAIGWDEPRRNGGGGGGGKYGSLGGGGGAQARPSTNALVSRLRIGSSPGRRAQAIVRAPSARNQATVRATLGMMIADRSLLRYLVGCSRGRLERRRARGGL